MPRADHDNELDERRPRPRLAWLETTLVTLALPTAGHFFDARDPFLLRAPFSWLALAPLLTGLRYGFAHGFGAALGLVVALSAAWRAGALGVASYPAQLAVGLLVTGMLAGEFNDAWTRRLGRLDAINAYRRMRLTEFTRSYHLLKVSHDRIEQMLAGSTQNLREAITTMRRELLGGYRQTPPLFGLEKLIVGVFANYGWVQVASLYVVADGALVSPAVADVGRPVEVAPGDALVALALDTGELASVRPEVPAAERNTSLLAAIPITDAYGRVWAVLCVENMLFIAFHEENLALLSILGGHIGDLLATGPALSRSRNLSVKEFVTHVRRSLVDRKRYDLPVALLAIVPGPDSAQAVTELVTGQRRGLDQVLVLEDRAGRSALLLLMPLTEERGVDGYVARLDENLKRKLGRSLADAGVRLHPRLLGAGDDAEAVAAEMAKLCGMDDADTARNISA